MKAVCKKLFSLMLVAILLVSAVPFQVSAEEIDDIVPEESTVATVATEATEATEAGDIAPASLEDDPAQIPAPAAEVVDKETNLYIEFQVAVNGSNYYRIGDLVKTQIGSRVATPNESKVLEVIRTIQGSSDGYKLVRWELASTGETFTSSTTINEGMKAMVNSDGVICVNAIVGCVAQNIDIHGAGAHLASYTFKVKIGEPYSYYNELPTPTWEGHTFLGWYKEDGTKVENNTIVTDLSDLTCKWITGHYSVSFEAYNGGWIAVKTIGVDHNAVLKTAHGTFPTDNEIKDNFKLAGWTIKGWEYTNDGGDTWKEFKEGSTKITADTIIRPLYKKNITLHANDKGHTTRSLEVTLGKKLPILPHPGTREGFAFDGWYLDSATSADKLICSKENLANVSVHPVVGDGLSNLYAGWSPAKTVYLYIHTNGNTKEHTKLVRYYDVSVNGFNLKDIDLYEIFPNYGKYDDKGDEKWGWYDAAQWENFCLNKHKYETTEVVNAEYMSKDDVHEFYIMLIDNGNNTSNNNSYNDNKNTVDSSNPTTGDDIFVAVTIMAVSACAVLLIFMNKKRFIK